MSRRKAYLIAAAVTIAAPLAFSVATGSIGWFSSNGKGRDVGHTSEPPESMVAGDMRYEVGYQPAEKRRQLAGTDTIASDGEDMIVYELRIYSSKERDLLKEDKENRIRYFGNLVAKDLQLVIGKDTAACIMAHLEQTYGLVPYLSVQIAFPPMTGWREQPHTILLNDRYFSSGPVVLKHQLKENEI